MDAKAPKPPFWRSLDLITGPASRAFGVFSALGLCLGLGLAALFYAAPLPLQAWQERIFDRIVAAPSSSGEVVVDIGAVDETGKPWDRFATARLVENLKAAAPQVIGFDALFAGSCDDPAAQALASALQGTPSVMGFLLSDQPKAPLTAAQLALEGPVTLWSAIGIDPPCPTFGATDLAAMVLLGDSDGLVRRVPVGVAVDGKAYPGLAVAVAAKAEGGLALAGPNWLQLGQAAPLPTRDGNLRVPVSAPTVWAARTVSAADLLAGRSSIAAKAVILVGSSLPQRGGLRPTAASPATPSVQIMADAVLALRAGAVTVRPGWAATAEAAFVALAGLAGLWLARRIGPLRAGLLVGGVSVLWACAAFAAVRLGGVLFDPILPALAVALILLMAVTARAADTARAERVLRASIGQLLPPALVSRIAAQPQLMRLEGEAREVTALFTGIEDFSSATAEMSAREVVAALAAYVSLTCGIVLRHGGMVDRRAGFSLHALFNAPLDQPGHEAAALACASEIIAATERFRSERGGFGPTRIGLECGPVVLGNVGLGSRIDYMALGPVVTLAARLQEASETFGAQICIGPALAARGTGLVELGEADIRGFGLMRLYTVAG